MSNIPAGPVRERRNPSLVAPVILVTIGILALMANTGMLPVNFWQSVLRLWPLLIILLGVELIIGQLRLPWLANLILSLAIVGAAIAAVVYVAQGEPGARFGAGSGPTQSQHVEQALQGAGSATIVVEFGLGDLTVRPIGDSPALASVDVQRSASRSDAEIVAAPGAAGTTVTIRPKDRSGPWFPFTGSSTYRWDVGLNTGVPLTLRIDSAMSSNNFDLRGVKLSSVRVDGAFSSTELTLPAAGSYDARVAAAFGSTNVVIPQGMAARIHSEGALSSISVDETRFPRSGDYYQSRDYSSATTKVDLRVEGAFSSVNVR